MRVESDSNKSADLADFIKLLEIVCQKVPVGGNTICLGGEILMAATRQTQQPHRPRVIQHIVGVRQSDTGRKSERII